MKKQDLEDLFIEYLVSKTKVGEKVISDVFISNINDLVESTVESLDWLIDEINEWVEENPEDNEEYE